jgi:transcriptional regulator with XRE-family HTH domain
MALYRAFFLGLQPPDTDLNQLVARGNALEIEVAFGKAVKIRRVELGISQVDLAVEGEFARSFLSGIERGTKAATTTTVWRLAQALKCKPSDLWLTAERLVLEEKPNRNAPTQKRKRQS